MVENISGYNNVGNKYYPSCSLPLYISLTFGITVTVALFCLFYKIIISLPDPEATPLLATVTASFLSLLLGFVLTGVLGAIRLPVNKVPPGAILIGIDGELVGITGSWTLEQKLPGFVYFVLANDNRTVSVRTEQAYLDASLRAKYRLEVTLLLCVDAESYVDFARRLAQITRIVEDTARERIPKIDISENPDASINLEAIHTLIDGTSISIKSHRFILVQNW